MNTTKIADIEIPEELTRAQKAEFFVLKRMLSKLEGQWNELIENSNPEQIQYNHILEKEYETKFQQIEALRELNLQIAKKQYEEEKAKIEADFEENKKNLFKQIIHGYHSYYVTIMNHLKELMGSDFNSFLSANEIDFPQIQEKTRGEKKPMHQPEEVKLVLTHYDSEKQIKKIISSAAESRAATTTESDGGESHSHSE
ncbi:hypothetical protein GPJ56_008445 [Histomonas meleagridis]|uniref:uncharacterized protein n=1 Tax=Histomonas meleagridis TaxID=135588 RepID=UPI003559D1A1|nr:hypothetical protein GPJ56_008445 [Histomonas meleagridis]KAH0806501.1 hypothetical protein GO595_000663 [Histomonas meleagridis]